jgi:hypothetical protein
MRMMRVPDGALNRQDALAVPGGFASGSDALSTPFGALQLLAVNPPREEDGVQPTAAFGWPSGSAQDVTM